MILLANCVFKSVKIALFQISVTSKASVVGLTRRVRAYAAFYKVFLKSLCEDYRVKHSGKGRVNYFGLNAWMRMYGNKFISTPISC